MEFSMTDENNRIFRSNMLAKFTSKSNINKPIKRVEPSKNKQVEVVKLPPLILARPLKEILEKSNFFKKDKTAKGSTKSKNKQSYAQASALKVDDILKL